jgi:Flp pilus assembly pilin Flp
MTLSRLIREFQKDEGGATAIEYGLIVGIIATVVVGIFGSGAALSGLYTVIAAIVTAMA